MTEQYKPLSSEKITKGEERGKYSREEVEKSLRDVEQELGYLFVGIAPEFDLGSGVSKDGVVSFSKARENMGKIVNILEHAKNKITNIDFTNANLGPEEAERLAGALKHVNNKLTDVNLYFNHIGTEGAKKIVEALGNENCKVEKIDLADNEIGLEGIEIVDALKKIKPELKIIL